MDVDSCTARNPSAGRPPCADNPYEKIVRDGRWLVNDSIVRNRDPARRNNPIDVREDILDKQPTTPAGMCQ